MIKKHSVRSNPFNAANLRLTIFEQQEGKPVNGTVIDMTDTSFVLQCTDGQIRKFDVTLLPKKTAAIRSELRHIGRLAG